MSALYQAFKDRLRRRKDSGNDLRYLTRAVTEQAPHVRAGTNVAAVMRCVQVALVPCLVFGVYNAGYQANAALAALGATAPRGWRGDVLAGFGLGYETALIPACLAHGALYFLPLLAVTAVCAAACERAFAALRARAVTPGAGVTVLLFSLSLPPTLPLWQAAIGIAFGIVVGREIFGGTGKNFLNPALTGLAFLYFAYPSALKGDGVWTAVDGFTGATSLQVAGAGGMEALRATGVTWWQSFAGRIQGSFGETSTLCCLLGAAYLLLRRVASWRVMAGVLLGMVATAFALPWASDAAAAPASGVPWFWHLTLGSFAFGAVFMATDPVSAAMTDAGRWIYGLLIGFLVVVIRVHSPVHPEGVMLAILLGNVFAPLIDYGVVRANIRRRRRRRA